MKKKLISLLCVASLLIGLLAAGVCLGYLAWVGWYLTAGDVAALLLDVVLLVLFVLLSVCLYSCFVPAIDAYIQLYTIVLMSLSIHL